MGTQLPGRKGTHTQFLTHVYHGETAGWIKLPMQLGTEVGLGPAPGNIVLDGDPSPHKRGTAPNFRPMSVVATWHRGRPHPRRIVLVGDPAPSKRCTAPQFSTHVYCCQCQRAIRCIRISLGTEVGLGPRDIVLDGDPAPPKGAQPPIFGLCLLWPKNGWMNQDATN